MNPVSDLARQWKTEAHLLRTYGDDRGAAVCELHSTQLKLAWEQWQAEKLTIADAAAESGYSEEHLRRLARSGDLPTTRNGERGQIRIARGDVPKKPGRSKSKGDASRASDGYDVSEDARDIAKRMRR